MGISIGALQSGKEESDVKWWLHRAEFTADLWSAGEHLDQLKIGSVAGHLNTCKQYLNFLILLAIGQLILPANLWRNQSAEFSLESPLNYVQNCLDIPGQIACLLAHNLLGNWVRISHYHILALPNGGQMGIRLNLLLCEWTRSLKL